MAMQQGDLYLLAKITGQIYRECAVNASRGLARNWLVLIGAVVAYFIFQFAARLFAPLGIAGGFLLGLIVVALLSFYYSWISRSTDREKISARSLIDFDQGLFFGIMSAGFILWVIEMVLDTLLEGQGPGAQVLRPCLWLIVAIVFNALPEVLTIHRYQSLLAFSNAARFTRENWIEWYLPLLVVLSPAFFFAAEPITLKWVLIFLSGTYPLLPAVVVIQTWSSAFALPGSLIGIVLAHWYMLFRALLFHALESGTRRKRVYEARNA